MKLTPLKTLGAIALFGCASSHAADWTDNLYLNGDIGPSLIPDTTVHAAFSLPSGGGRGSGQLKTDPGIRGDLSLGYNLNKSWAVEVESGVTWNTFWHTDFDFYQIPVLARALYHVPLGHSLSAYAGVGVGEVAGIWDTQFLTSSFSRPIHQSDTDWSFAYEAEAGIKYTPTQHIEVGLGYKFLGADQYDWHFKNAAAQFNEKISTSAFYTHMALVSFTYKF